MFLSRISMLNLYSTYYEHVHCRCSSLHLITNVYNLIHFLTSTLSEKCDPGLVATEVNNVVLNPSEMFKFGWRVFFPSPPPFLCTCAPHTALTRFMPIFLTYLFSYKVWELAGGKIYGAAYVESAVHKGTVPRGFRLKFFSRISFTKVPEYLIRAVSNFFKKSWRYSQLKMSWLVANGKNLQSEKF